jgi:hypothetical protein
MRLCIQIHNVSGRREREREKEIVRITNTFLNNNNNKTFDKEYRIRKNPQIKT